MSKATSLVEKVIKDADDQVTKNRVKINRFASKYKSARICFNSDDENDDLHEFLFDISHEYDIPEDKVYYMFIESKYTLTGKLTNNFEELFATRITLFETLNLKTK